MSGIKLIALDDLEEAVSLLRAGGVLLYPTETSYALGCDATNQAAVQRIFAIKARPLGKGLPLILPPEAELEQFIVVSPAVLELAKRHWPGPLNIIAERAEASPVATECETAGTQSVRRSSSTIASELARQLGRPLVATSANLAGDAAIYRVDELLTEFTHEQPDALLDAGDLPIVPASTTVKVDQDKVEIVRQGSIVISL